MQPMLAAITLPSWLVATIQWLIIWGDPRITSYDYGEAFGGFITWLKVVGLFALLGWSLSWVLAAFRTRERAKADGLDVAALVALVGCLAAVVVNVLQTTGQLSPNRRLAGLPIPTAMGLAAGAVILVWVERSLWQSVRRIGRGSDTAVLAGIHGAIALGLAISFGTAALQVSAGGPNAPRIPAMESFLQGVRLGATYMGFVVLAKVAWLLIPELFAMRPRRLYAIAKQAVTESTRRMWAPWVVIVLFAVILAFTHWFLPASQQRPAELGRIYVGTLTLLCMLLLTVMVTVLAPLSLPQDIQMQTIYTVVSKPVRRIELILGRILGYMAIVTALTLVFGVISLVYLDRNIGRTITDIEAQAKRVQETDPDRARVLEEQADQLRTRMSARLPVKGALTFLDSKGTPHLKGIDVGQELEYRSHIEGATEASAIWHFGGAVEDPYDPRLRINRRIPVESLLKPGTIEAVENELALKQLTAAIAERQGQNPDVSAADKARIAAELTRTRSEIQQLTTDSARLKARLADLNAQAKQAEAANKPADVERLRAEANELVSPDIPMEMTFTIYRTTKGRVGEPVYAEIEVENPNTNVAEVPDDVPDPRVLHQQAEPPGVLPRRVARRAERHGPLQEPDAVPRDGRERLLPPRQRGELRPELLQGAARDLAPGDGARHHRRLRRDVPVVAGGPAVHDRLLRGRARRVLGPRRVLQGHDGRRRPLRSVDPPAVPRQPDERAGRHARRGRGQDPRRRRHPGDAAHGLPDPQPVRARRQQHRRRGVRRDRPAGPLEHPDRPGLRHPVHHLRLLHPQESRGGGVSYLSNQQRKIVFSVVILLLFAGMFPYKKYLQAEARKKDLGEATIGEVDTGSFVLKLFLLGGFRGMAANVLWTRAIDFQKVQEWDKLKVTVDMITKLQPHFLAIWTFQSWNLTYNVSVEWDAPEDKYEWIKRGIKFVQDGVNKNQKSPDLIWDTAWYYYHKLGFSDETIILRRLFRDDEDESFKQSPIEGNTIYSDNFQLGRDWFTRAVRLVDSGGGERQGVTQTSDATEFVDAPTQRKGRPGDLPFRSMPAHAQTRYALSLEKESIKGVEATFGPRAMEQWRRALADWQEFGDHEYRAPNEVPVDGKMVTFWIKIDEGPKTNPERAAKLHPNAYYWSERWADQMNYPYWKDRCMAEMQVEGTNARRLFYEGTKAYKSADFPLAVQKYKEGLKIWKDLLDKHVYYRDDELNKKDTGLIVKRYARACQQSQIEVPQDTPFLEFLKTYEGDNTKDPFDAMEMLDASTATTKPAAKPKQ